jgi:O-phospho-L-seryl-tRNASec:L-selenocysteinyl-tRNA synthase
MTPENVALASGLVSRAYIEQGAQALARRRRRITSLLSERRLPDGGWDEMSIEMLLHEAAAMDSNNFIDGVGVGEREARVACPLVARRHYGLAHGIGRSGDIAAEQPKAAGSTLLARLCNLLAADALRAAGLPELGDATVLPLATGMALTLTLLALAKRRPPGARRVRPSRLSLPCVRERSRACVPRAQVRRVAPLRPKDVREGGAGGGAGAAGGAKRAGGRPSAHGRGGGSRRDRGRRRRRRRRVRAHNLQLLRAARRGPAAGGGQAVRRAGLRARGE